MPLTVLGVTALSTLAMVLYPVIFVGLGLSEIHSGYLIGATIHDVAQVVGAGYSISDTAGEVATFTKLLRVALLPIVLISIGLLYRRTTGAASLPWFLVAFVVLMLARNLLDIPEAVLDVASSFSLFLLVTAISALGVRTSLGKILSSGSSGLMIIGIQTIALLTYASAFVLASRLW